jgi:hypothetical protein
MNQRKVLSMNLLIKQRTLIELFFRRFIWNELGGKKQVKQKKILYHKMLRTIKDQLGKHQFKQI